MKTVAQNKGTKEFKDLVVTTSWDDGQKIDLKLAELLTKYNVKGTFYITKSYRDPLEKRDVIKIDIEHEIGAHTLNHIDLTKVFISEAKREIKESKAYIEEMVGHDVDMFCYPLGRYNEEIKRVVKDAGFIGARTCNHCDFDMPNDPYEWQITLHASNGSPRLTFKIWRINHLSIRSLMDWEIRAKQLFDFALKKGGVYHLWGHAWEFEKKNEWDKLERVLKYLSNREEVKYVPNGAVMERINEKR